MTYEDYLTACLSFAKDSQEWYGIMQRKFYLTDGYDCCGEWYESCDGDHGGLDVSWAFHMAADDIRKEAPGRYAREIVDLVRVSLDNALDPDTFYELLNEFKD